ncbi:GGDEF domain-containing protein [Anaerosporobacter sp.]|uniref:GGDEF domain-containing protein n=1 Tax=Anaerosporobacter sp. TaxID=1872529 RepID=UPI00286F7B43|nr:GGDEF domain-containing protein [Anaerosporobacter sp.]
MLVSVIGLVYERIQEKEYTEKLDITKLNIIGEYTVNGESNTYTLQNNKLISMQGHNKIVITGHFNRDIEAGKNIIMRIDNTKVKMSVNGEQVYAFGEEGTFPSLAKSAGNLWQFYECDGISTADTITLELTNIYNNHVDSTFSVFLENLSVGDDADVVLKYIRGDMWNVFLSFFIIGIGIISVLFSIKNPTTQIEQHRLIIFSGLAITCGAWSFIDFRVQNFFYPYPVFNNCLDIILLMAMLGCLMFYLAVGMKNKGRIAMHIAGIINFLFILVMTIGQFMGNTDYYDYVLAIDVQICVCAVVAVLCSIYEAIKSPAKERFQILLAPVLLAIGGFSDVVFNYMGIFKQTIFMKVCFIIYVFCQFVYLTEIIKELYKKNMRMEVYKELAYTDVMTGTKNRTAFNEYVVGLEKRLLKQEIAGILVVDINNLKLANDSLGHQYGDKLIINVCKILKEVFSKSCVYRIGGDEFAVILEGNDLKEYSVLAEKLDLMIEEYNQDMKQEEWLSIAKGVAVWNDVEVDSFEELFVKADNAMYTDKIEKKKYKKTNSVNQ